MQTTGETPSHGCIFKRLDDAVITEEYRKKAQAELNETDELREECLKKLRILLKEVKDLNANTSDEFLLQFLRARKFKTELAFLMLKNYYRHRLHYPIVYQNLSPKQSLQVLKSNLLNFLPLRTADGSAVWVARVGSWSPNDFSNEDLLRFGILCHIKVLKNPVTQINGIVSIVDLQGFSRTHVYHMPFSIVRSFINLIQECLPMRHKAIHIVNNPLIFGIIFAIVKPLLKRKFRDRIHFHGYDLSSLHQHVPPSILPEELGGTQGPFQNKQFYDSLVDAEEEFLRELNYGYNNVGAEER